MNYRKLMTDLTAIVLSVGAIVTGMTLHSEIHHKFVYDNATLWNIHEAIGIVVMALIATHCVQHKFWFRNYRKIKPEKKRVTTILLVVVLVVAVSGIVLMSGSHSRFVSIFHYVTGIFFIILAMGHVVRRRKLLSNLSR